MSSYWGDLTIFSESSQNLNNTINFLDICRQSMVYCKLLRNWQKIKFWDGTCVVGNFQINKAEIKFLTSIIKRFTKLCSTCKLVDEITSLQNIFIVLGYPGNLVYKVIITNRLNMTKILTAWIWLTIKNTYSTWIYPT